MPKKKNSVIPYRCTGCGKAYVKLWREYQTCAEQSALECVDCALKSQDKDIVVAEDGTHDFYGQRIDQIGWRVPAVPDESGTTFWGYTSVPDAGVRWWKALPLR